MYKGDIKLLFVLKIRTCTDPIEIVKLFLLNDIVPFLPKLRCISVSLSIYMIPLWKVSIFSLLSLVIEDHL